MSKVIVEDLSGTIESFTVELAPMISGYSTFHSTVGTVLGNIAGERGGLEDVSAMFDDGSDYDTNRTELAAALFYETTNGEVIATVHLVAE